MNVSENEAWDYFSRDRGYSDVLHDRLVNRVEMDSARTLADYLRQSFSGDLAIVDFGGGPGHYFPAIDKIYDKGALTYRCVDIDALNVERGKQYFAADPRLDFQVGSVLEPAQFLAGRNCVISANTLPHVPSVRPLFEAMRSEPGITSFLFRMLVGGECVQIKKHLSNEDFEGLFEQNFQHNNIYSLPYLQGLLGSGWEVNSLPDRFSEERLASHSVPMQEADAFYGNRVSRAVGDMVFKGDIYMPWAFVMGRRISG